MGQSLELLYQILDRGIPVIAQQPGCKGQLVRLGVESESPYCSGGGCRTVRKGLLLLDLR